MTDEIWMCWWKGDGSRDPWALHWTAAYTRRDSIAKHDADNWNYAKERRAGRVICKRTRLVVDTEPGGAS